MFRLRGILTALMLLFLMSCAADVLVTQQEVGKNRKQEIEKEVKQQEKRVEDRMKKIQKDLEKKKKELE